MNFFAKVSFSNFFFIKHVLSLEINYMFKKKNEMDLKKKNKMTQSDLHIRTILKMIRDCSKTAYDELPSGRTLGEVANELAITQYAKKITRKRERAREARSQKRKFEEQLQRNFSKKPQETCETQTPNVNNV